MATSGICLRKYLRSTCKLTPTECVGLQGSDEYSLSRNCPHCKLTTIKCVGLQGSYWHLTVRNCLSCKLTPMKCVGLHRMGSSSSEFPAFHVGVDTCGDQFAAPPISSIDSSPDETWQPGTKSLPMREKGLSKGGQEHICPLKEQKATPLCSNPWHERLFPNDTHSPSRIQRRL